MKKPALSEIIKFCNLAPMPLEGGLFSRNYLSEDIYLGEKLPDRYQTVDHHFGSAILMILSNKPDSFSALHKLKTDEIYHFYLGDPLELVLLYPDGTSKIIEMGQDITNGQYVQYAVPRGVWQGSQVKKGGVYSFFGTTMAPAFDKDDFELGDRDILLTQYPERREQILSLTRLDPLKIAY